MTLENCVKITQEPAPANLIHIVTKTGTLTLNALSDEEQRKWVDALQSVAFKDKGGNNLRNSVIEEDNDLYCTSFSDGIFTVRLMLSEISVKCHLEARPYILHLTATDLQLKCLDDKNGPVAKWPYRFIRKYGYRDGKFTFEAGRKCDTGEGEFKLEHSNPQEIFRCMAAKMKSMKKLISGDSMASLDCGDHQLNAALSMEAGSRSPLPPSPNHHSHSENDLNQSGHLYRGFLSSNDSLNNVSTSSSSISVIKHIPHKPPRKSITDNHESRTPQKYIPKKYQSYDLITGASNPETIKTGTIVLKSPSSSDSQKSLLSGTTDQSSTETPPRLPVRNESKATDESRDYECILSISNAWRTRGLDDVKHTERTAAMVSEDVDVVEFAWQRSQSQKEPAGERKTSSTMATTAPTSPLNEDYERLQFFPYNSKTSGDYKTIVRVTPPGYKKQNSQPVTSNDYEIVGAPPDTLACRLADDSYMGYGKLRTDSSASSSKSTTTTTLTVGSNEDLLGHRKFNGLEYAIVSKPKRV